jgi:hypothetical protein
MNREQIQYYTYGFAFATIIQEIQSIVKGRLDAFIDLLNYSKKYRSV